MVSKVYFKVGNYSLFPVNEIWNLEGLGECKGHAFRIGGTMHLLLLGVDPRIVMAIGRWSSKAFLRYWRNCDKILVMFVGFSMDSLQSVIMTMLNFKAMVMS